MKKLGLLFLTILMMLLFAVSASALEPSGSLGDNVTYTYDSTTGEVVISGNGDMNDYSYYNRSPLYESDIKSVVIEYGVTSIGERAFELCLNLTNIIIPDSVTSIGDSAFFYCWHLTSITIPDSVTSIGRSTFSVCTDLESITIPNSVTSIGYTAFSYCTALTNITVDEDNKNYSNDSCGVLFDKDKNVLIEYPAGNTRTTYVIPDSVTSIEEYAFEYCDNLTSITIPDSVTSIGNKAFYFCENLTSITIPDSVTSIGESAFAGSKSLINITIPNSVTSIGREAFYYCQSLTNIIIPESVISIGNSAFENCRSLTSITVDENNTIYSSDSMGVLFNKDKTELVVYPAGKTEATYTIPDNVMSIAPFAFYYCENLISVRFSNSMTSIDYYDFENCISLTSLIIPDSVTSIGNYAFEDCTSLTDVYYYGTEKQWAEIISGLFDKSLNNVTIHYNYCPNNAANAHIFISEKTAPTCTEQGYTTYTCDCGYSYVGDYVGTKPHSYTSVVTRPATHLSEGVRTYTCSACGNSYTEAIAKTKEHIYNAVSNVVAPTCEDKGYTVYVCECGSNKKDNYTDKTGHKYNGQTCVNCGKNCSCNCHKGGFMGFIWKITLFFNKLFKTNKTCACGAAHY